MGDSDAWDEKQLLQQLDLFGNDQVIAISQAALSLHIGNVLSQYNDLFNIQVQINKKVVLDATVDSITLQCNPGLQQGDSTTLLLNLKSGKCHLHSHSIDVNNWGVAWEIKLPQGLGSEKEFYLDVVNASKHTRNPDDISRKSSRLQDLEQKLKANTPELDDDDDAAAAWLGTFIHRVQEDWLAALEKSGAGRVKLFSMANAKAQLPPSLNIRETGIQLMDFRPFGKQGGQPQIDGNNAMLLLQQGDLAHSAPRQLQWTSNFFPGSTNCLLALSKENFWDRYLLKELNGYLQSVTYATNDLQRWLVRENKTLPDSFRDAFNSEPNFNSDVASFERRPDDPVSWGGPGYSNRGGRRIGEAPFGDREFNISAECTSDIRSTAKRLDGQGKVDLHSTIDIFHRINYQSPAGILQSEIASEVTLRVTVECTTTLSMDTINKSKLEVSTTPTSFTATPTVDTHKQDGGNNPFADALSQFINIFFNRPQAELESDLKKFTNNALIEQLQKSNVATNLAGTLNSLGHQYIFPGGKGFEMKDPIFTNKGHLIVKLTYKS
jgi:hypothetical protein